MERAPRHSLASTATNKTGSCGDHRRSRLPCGLLGGRSNEQRARSSEGRQTRSDCHSARMVPESKQGGRAHGYPRYSDETIGCHGGNEGSEVVEQGRALGRETHTSSRAEGVKGVEGEGGADTGRHRQVGAGSSWADVGPACMAACPLKRWEPERAVEA